MYKSSSFNSLKASYNSALAGAKKALPISSKSKKITKGVTRPLAPNEIDPAKFFNNADYPEDLENVEPSSTTAKPKIPLHMYRQLIKEGKYTPKPKKEKVIHVPSKVVSFGHMMSVGPTHPSNRKYSVQVQYIDHKGKLLKKTVFFGQKDHQYYVEKPNPTQEDEIIRSREVNRTTNDANPLYPNFWVNSVLNRKNCGSPFEAFMITCQEHIL